MAIPRADAVPPHRSTTAVPASRSSATSSPTRCGQQYGTDFAITNSGGLRADLTCPAADPARPTSARPPSTRRRRHFPITRGQVLGVLPFGNVVGDDHDQRRQLKDFLETAVAPPPATGIGRFGQVSGLCVTYNVEAAAKQFDASGVGQIGTGARVTNVVRPAADGTCDFVAGTPVVLDAAHTYTVTINDFMMTGGDGYPDVRSSATTQDLLDQDVADYLATLPGNLVSPVIRSRVHCYDPNPGSGNDCLLGSP